MSSSERGEDRGAGLHLETIARLGKPPLVTGVLVLVMAAIHLWMIHLSEGNSSSIAHLLLIGGAKVDTLIREGELWRIPASTLLHGSFSHLLLNILGLILLGWFVENLVGSSYYLFAVFAVATGSAVGSLALGQLTSVGASGILFGLMGISAGFSLRHWSQLPKLLRQYALFIPLIAAAGGILSGWSVEVVDNHAHLAGLLIGFIAGLGAPLPGEEHSEVCRTLIFMLAATAAVLFFLATSIVLERLNLNLPPLDNRLSSVEIRGQEVSFPRTWSSGWVNADGSCVPSEDPPGVQIEAGRIACFFDPYFTMILIGDSKSFRRNPMYMEAFLRKEGMEPDAYRSLELFFHESASALTFGLAVYKPLSGRYLGLFRALASRPPQKSNFNFLIPGNSL